MSIINKLLGHVGKRLKPLPCHGRDREFESRHARQYSDEEERERKIEEVIAVFDKESFHVAAKSYSRRNAIKSFHNPNDPDYLLMLSMGRGIVPILLKDLEKVGRLYATPVVFDPWCHMMLLRDLTGARPWKVGKDEGRYSAQLKA